MRLDAPAKRPCGSCPYRRDVPGGVWHREEYEKLPKFDLPTPDQPAKVFGCHRQNGKLCSGWVAVHDMTQNLGLRLALSMGFLTPEVFEATLDYETDVPLFESGAAAALNGLRSLHAPDAKARRIIDKLTKQLTADPEEDQSDG